MYSRRFFIRYNADCDCPFCDDYNQRFNKVSIGSDKYWIDLLNHNISKPNIYHHDDIRYENP